MKKATITLASVFFSALLINIGGRAQATDHSQHPPAPVPETGKEESAKPTIPDLEVLDQDGRRVRFYSDLVKGKVVGINFIFTTCTTICPPMGATYAKLQTQLGDRLGREVFLISISVDPVTDTPERMKAWGAKFGAKPGWTLVTGKKVEIDKLLSALGGYTAQKEDHSPTMLVGNDATGMWSRIYGLSKPTQILSTLERLAKGPKAEAPAHDHSQMAGAAAADKKNASAENPPARNYFSDVTLINQHGEKMRFYSDLLKGKIVVINSFFTTCTSVCPPLNRNFAKIQDAVGDRLGKDVYLLSISVDPTNDTPPRLKEYAEKFQAKPGWYFLTGAKENVDWALYKLGQYVDARESHSTIVIIGNEPRGLWKKAFGLAKTAEIIKLVEEVMNDKQGEENVPTKSSGNE